MKDVFNNFDTINQKRVFDYIDDNTDGINNMTDFWKKVETEVEKSTTGTTFIPTTWLSETMSKFDNNYWNWLYDCGKRVHKRVYLWSIGYKLAYDMLTQT